MSLRTSLRSATARLEQRFGRYELPKEVFVVVVLGAVLGIGWMMWRYSDSPFNDPKQLYRVYRDSEQWAKQHKYDFRKDPYMARLYYQYHPNEKRGTPGKDAPLLPIYMR